MTALRRLLCKIYFAAGLIIVSTIVVGASLAVVGYGIAHKNDELIWKALPVSNIVAAVTFLVSITITVFAKKASISFNQRRETIVRDGDTDERPALQRVAILPWLKNMKGWYPVVWGSIVAVYIILVLIWAFQTPAHSHYPFTAFIFAIPIYCTATLSYFCTLTVVKAVETIAGKPPKVGGIASAINPVYYATNDAPGTIESAM